ncbi:MAG: hypothetical protein ACE5OO_04495 [Candidatus Bathyarchaeia archaeon]
MTITALAPTRLITSPLSSPKPIMSRSCTDAAMTQMDDVEAEITFPRSITAAES